MMWSCGNSGDGYSVKMKFEGDMSQLKGDTLILSGMMESEPIADTVVLVNGEATFKGEKIDTPQYVSIVVKGNPPQRIARFFLENCDNSITVKFIENAKAEVAVKAGRFQTVSDSLQAIQKELVTKFKVDSLMARYRSASAEEKAAIVNLIDSVETVLQKSQDDYIAANPTSMYALYMLSRNLNQIPFEEAEARFAHFKDNPEYAKNKNLEAIAKAIDEIRALQPGNVAPDFTQNDPDGNPVTFSDIYKKNKVTMVDFWASWCNPCRAFNPTLVQIYKEYHPKGFEILGVSLDKEKEKWEKAIKDDKLTWYHVSDLGFWNNEVSKMYCVKFIPQSILVDQNGVIIKRQPSEEEIVEILKANL